MELKKISNTMAKNERGEDVVSDVYEIAEKIVTVKQINEVQLRSEKAALQAKINVIDEQLSAIEGIKQAELSATKLSEEQ